MPGIGDVYEIGLKSFERGAQSPQVTQEQQIERKIRVQLQYGRAILEFECLERAFRPGSSLWSGMDGEKTDGFYREQSAQTRGW